MSTSTSTPAVPARSRLARSLATWAVVCFALAAVVYALFFLFTATSGPESGLGSLGFYALAGFVGNPFTQWLTWLGLVFTAGSVAAHVATEAIDRAAARAAAASVPAAAAAEAGDPDAAAG